MEVRACRVAGAADAADHLSRIDVFACADIDVREMAVARVAIKAVVVDEDLVAVAVTEVSGLDDLPVEEAGDGGSVVVTEIDSAVEFPFPADWMDAPAKGRGDGKVFCEGGRWEYQGNGEKKGNGKVLAVQGQDFFPMVRQGGGRQARGSSRGIGGRRARRGAGCCVHAWSCGLSNDSREGLSSKRGKPKPR